MEGSELALTSALLAVLGSVVYFSFTTAKPDTQTTSSKAPTSAKAKGNARRGKKRGMSSLIPTPTDHDDSGMEKGPSTPSAAPKLVIQRSHEPSIPGSLPGLGSLLSASEMESVHSAASSGAKSTQKKKRKAPKKDKAQESEVERMHPGGLMLAPPPPAPVSSKQKGSPQSLRHETSGASELDSEYGWTKVTRGKERGTSSAGGGTMESTSDAGVTTSVTEEEDSVASVSQPVSATRERGKTLTSAERFLPKAAETNVDDMLDGPKPGIARVMRVTGSSSAPQPAQGLIWEDYEDAEDVKGSGADADEEDAAAWVSVDRKRRGGTQTPSTYASDSHSTFASTSASASAAASKKARQNAAKREAEKSAKGIAEKERLAKLQQHKRELEKLRIAEQFKGKSARNVLSGGQQAKVDSDGKLIWD